MGIIYRKEKGAPLSADDLDQNFKILTERLDDMEEGAEAPESIGTITHLDGKIQIKGTQGTDFGTLSLPQVSFCPKGEWAMNIHYSQGDVAHYKGALYRAKKSTKSAEFKIDAWDVLLPA